MSRTYPPDRTDLLIARLDALSRERPLTNRESVLLERGIARAADRDRRRVRRGNVPVKPRWTEEQDRIARDAVERGLSYRAAGELVGRSGPAVQDRVYRVWCSV